MLSINIVQTSVIVAMMIRTTTSCAKDIKAST